MTVSSTEQKRHYLDYLPAIFRDAAGPTGDSFLSRFLQAFEQILGGVGNQAEPGLEGAIAGLADRFDPAQTPEEFLPWLASWVALTLRDDWDPAERRRFISRAVASYALRGTVAGLEHILGAYTDMPVTVLDFRRPMSVGECSTVGVDTMIGEGPPHYFLVKMLMVSGTTGADLDIDQRRRIARAIIDQEAPAHTYYDLIIQSWTIQIGVHSTVGVDTLLGTAGEI